MKQLVEFLINSKSTGIIKKYPEFVDLGLSVKWCTCNLGAETPEDEGLFFLWGYTEGYKPTEKPTNDRKNKNIFNQNNKPKYNQLDNRNLLPEDDAATQMLGPKYHIPSYDNFNELIRKTNKKLTNDKCGVEFVGYNGNYIIIPFNGYIDSAGNYDAQNNQNINIWTNELEDDDSAYITAFCSTNRWTLISSIHPWYYIPIRPVYY